MYIVSTICYCHLVNAHTLILARRASGCALVQPNKQKSFFVRYSSSRVSYSVGRSTSLAYFRQSSAAYTVNESKGLKIYIQNLKLLLFSLFYKVYVIVFQSISLQNISFFVINKIHKISDNRIVLFIKSHLRPQFHHNFTVDIIHTT